MILAKPVYICAARRSPIACINGGLSSLSASEIAAYVVKDILASHPAAAKVEEMILGQVLPAGAGQAPARQVIDHSGLHDGVKACSVNRVCASGMKAVMLGAASLALGESQLVFAGGMESMSLAPHLLPGCRSGLRFGDANLFDHITRDGLTDAQNGQAMGDYAERCANKYEFSRCQQDEFAIESYERALAAVKNKAFADEIVPITYRERGKPQVIKQDEEPQRFKGSEKLRALPPLFTGCFEESYLGSVTAGNASSLNDGAAVLLLASKEACQKWALKPLAQIVSWHSYAGPSPDFTTAPIPCVQQLLKENDLTVRDIDLWEINEAFAVVTMAALQELALNPDQVNVCGGAVSLGHPIGCTGARILVTLLHALWREGRRRGVAALCIGGGEASAMLVENLMSE